MRIRCDPERELDELRTYLGPRYDNARLERWQHELDEELERLGDEQRLYRSSEAYLYNLTAFAMSGTKDPYLATLAREVHPPAPLLDYGCGIGSDGLCLLEAGYRVAFADFDNPSTRYLRWRLERRGLKAPIYDLDRGGPPDGFELAYSFDVIEHVEDPFLFLGELERRARLVLVNVLEPLADDTALHHSLPVSDLLARALGGGLRRYDFFHDRSHLLLYEPGTRSRLLPALRARGAISRLRRRRESAR